MGAVADAVSDVVSSVGDAVGDVTDAVVQAAGDVVNFVGDTVSTVVETAVNDPIGTIAKVAAVATGQFELLPVISAVDVVAHGGDIQQALTSAAISYVAPEVGSGITSGLADTAFGQALTDIGTNTGIESLPSAVGKGLATAGLQTGAGIVNGQDVGTALTRGLTAGVGSGVGAGVTAEADLNGPGTSIADKLVGSGVGAATTAALRGGDATTAAEKAIASGIVGTGINYAGGAANDAYKSATDDTVKKAELETTDKTLAELPTATENVAPNYPQLASSGATASDAGLTPTEEAIKQLKGTVTVYDPATGLPVKNAAEEENVNQLIAALYPETQASNVAKVDAAGNAFDAQGRQLGSAENFGLVQGTDTQGNPAWITANGEVIKASPSSYNNEPVTDLGEVVITAPKDTSGTTAGSTDFSLGDQAGDYPAKITNNPDGSTTVLEQDGSQRIFNVDGSVTFIDANGKSSEEFGAKPEEPPPEEKPASDSSLANLAGALLGGSALGGGSMSGGKTTGGTKTTTSPKNTNGTSGGSIVPSLIGAGLGIYDNLTSGTQSTGAGSSSGYGFNWNPNAVNAPIDGRAYGQQFLNPTYIKAAEGGLLSLTPPPYMQSPLQNQQYPTGDIPQQSAGSQPQAAYGQMPYTQPDQNQFGQMKPQYIQPTIDDGNHLSVSNISSQQYNADPSNSVNMFAGGGMPIAMNTGGISSLGGYSDGGRLLKGPGDGMSDDIPASIAGRQPARLANEEFVIPADVVSHLGNGSSEAGAKVLYQMMERVRKARTGNPKQGKQIDAHQYMPKVRK